MNKYILILGMFLLTVSFCVYEIPFFSAQANLSEHPTPSGKAKG